jgi:pyrroline-5-carboxylate reductase
MLNERTIAFLGAGSMAEAMISGMSNSEDISNENIIVTNRSNEDRLNEIENKYGVTTINSSSLDFDQVDLIILAMKPKDIDKALASIKDSITPKHVIISVLAGIPTSYIEENLHEDQQVIRVMPNTSSMIGESATALSSGKSTSKENVEIVNELLNTIGEVFIISEDKMDVFTGLAGSGPAYFYYLMEHMELEGVKNGIDDATTRQIIAQTIVGAAKMIQQQNETPTVLREKVTSPNGTTAAGLEALDSNGGGKAIAEAVKHAASRSKEISEQLQEKLLTELVK